jgi:hypothetical protein
MEKRWYSVKNTILCPFVAVSLERGRSSAICPQTCNYFWHFEESREVYKNVDAS